jgi:hypothetical protein
MHTKSTRSSRRRFAMCAWINSTEPSVQRRPSNLQNASSKRSPTLDFRSGSQIGASLQKARESIRANLRLVRLRLSRDL